MPANPGCAEILPIRSRVSDEDATADGALPGAERVEGALIRATMGRRALRRDMLRALEESVWIDVHV